MSAWGLSHQWPPRVDLAGWLARQRSLPRSGSAGENGFSKWKRAVLGSQLCGQMEDL